MKIASVDAGKIFSHWDYTIGFEDKVENLKKSLVAKNKERIQTIQNLIERQQKLSKQYQKAEGDMTVEQKAQMDQSYKNLGREIKALEQDRLDYFKQEQP